MESRLPKLQSNFSIDCVVFGFDEGELKVLLIERGDELYTGMMAVPGDLVQEQEDIDDGASRILYELTGLKDIFLKQFHTFGDVNRHPLGRVITVAYYSLIRVDEEHIRPSSFARKVFWYPVSQIKALAFDHLLILNKALATLRKDITYQPIGFELLPPKFTLSQLQALYEAILDMKLDKRNFRKKIIGMNLLTETGEKQIGVAHRAANLYQFKRSRYEKLKEKGFIFEI